MNKKTLVIIPARGGSKRIPRKNIKQFLSKAIIGYPIEAALNSNVFDRVVVSTDDQEIADVALNFGADIPFLRTTKNSDDFATTYDVIQEVLEQLDEVYDYVCCIYPTSVFVNAVILKDALDILEKTKDATSIVSVLSYSHPIQRALSLPGKYLSSISPEFYNTRTQDLETHYHDAGQFYIFKPFFVEHEKKLVTNKAIPYLLPESRAHDIDSIEDWEVSEIKYKRLSGKTSD
ncbi:pseudaminic acid cytidylyltransferase [Cognaticolwellia beringensis]|uniref:Pseudaminic acid cytidylyltransferase n=1 Tax=Cognaticolwellia beringensis TaxID=1967665 RepID=A0A222GD92_9GAMM|nr:pseudaminic acid cytidylyltransferase [Cognaticolwellia beringensis]ASP49838.1 pseudaminic acid cytidylyltransferase [Cognaticolwellia beringensis]